jgi:hypothetical protein
VLELQQRVVAVQAAEHLPHPIDHPGPQAVKNSL